MDVTKNAKWTNDCQGKQDLDFPIIQAYTRYYPDFTAICTIVMCPDEYGGDGVELCDSGIISGTDDTDIKKKVRVWYNSRYIDALRKAMEETKEK